MKSWYLPAAVILAITLISLPLALQGLRQRQELRREAAPTASFAVNPPSQSVVPGQPATVTVEMDPGGNDIASLSFRLTFDSGRLSNPQVTLGSVFSNQQDLGSPVIGSNYVEVALMRTSGTAAYTGGTVNVATITFDTSSSRTGNAQLTFEPNYTQIFDINTNNVLSATSDGLITLSSTQATPTPTPIPGAASFSVVPSSQNLAPDGTTTVDIVMDPATNDVASLGFRLQFDYHILNNVQATVGSVFSNQEDFGGPSYGLNYVIVSLARNPGTAAYSGGPVTVASISFHALSTATGTANLTFVDPGYTKIYDTNSENVLAATYNGIIIIGGATATPTPTVPAGTTPTPTTTQPTPTRTPTPSPTRTPTPSRTPTLPPGTPTPTSQPPATPTPSGPATATIQVYPTTQTIYHGQSPTVDIVLNPGNHEVSGVYFRVGFDNTLLTSPQVTIGSVFASQENYRGATIGSNYIEVEISRQAGTAPYTGNPVTLATINFNTPTTASGVANIIFDPPTTTVQDTQVLDIYTNNVLASTFDGQIVFSRCADPRVELIDINHDGNIDFQEVITYINNYLCNFTGTTNVCASEIPDTADGAVYNVANGVLDFAEVILAINNYNCNVAP